MVIGEDENLDVSREGSNSVSGEELVFSMDDALDNKKGIKKTSSIGSKSSIASSIKKKYHVRFIDNLLYFKILSIFFLFRYLEKIYLSLN